MSFDLDMPLAWKAASGDAEAMLEALQPNILKAHVRELKGPVQTPKRLEIHDRIPLTQVGKRDKKALKRAFVEQASPEMSGDTR